MTDSDFFTESDADAHEDIVRGDRRAQVIDGRLFCAPGELRRCCPSFETAAGGGPGGCGEEMDSSGVYSDLDKRQDDGSGGLDDAGEHTTDTGDTEVSMRSQPPTPGDRPVPALVTKNMLVRESREA